MQNPRPSATSSDVTSGNEAGFESLDDVIGLLGTIAPSALVLRGDTRERLLDAALDLFAERGFAGTSIRNVCSVVGITPAALYSHFSSKEEILVAALARLYTTFLRYVFVIDGVERDLGLREIAQRHMEFQFEFPTLAESGKRFLYNANPHIPPDVFATVTRVRKFYTSRIAAAIRAHGTSGDVPVEPLAEVVMAVCDQVSYGAIGGPPNDRTVIPMYLRMIEALVSG